MEYINCVLSKNTTIAFLKYLNSFEFEKGEESDFFERAKRFDDVSLVICLKHFFEIADKIRKGKNVDLSYQHLVQTSKNIEDENVGLLAELINFDKEFILDLIEFDYLTIKNGQNMNLGEVLATVLREKYNGQII
jgi:hypothetical protein